MKLLLSKRARIITVSLALIVALTGASVFGAGVSKTLDAFYNDITVYVNGTIITPTDVTGASTEPFIVDGTVYLPVRAIGEALGLNVEWSGATNSVYVGAAPDDYEGLYAAAIKDSMIIEPHELFPLVDISASSNMSTLNDDGHVLFVVHHRFPDSYKAGEEYKLIFGDVWAFNDQEMIKWYGDNKDGVTDWPLRFRQLLGLPPDRTYTHFSAMWVDPADVTRPGYAWELSDTHSASAFSSDPSDELKAWFNSNIIYSYFDSPIPWTRLGYTYDWKAGHAVYGLSEFLVRKDAVTFVEFTMTTEEFLEWLETQIL